MFETTFMRVFSHEGRYQCHREDRGNWTSGIVGVGELKGTKFGISAMTYPTLDIVNLTLNQAKEIYHRDWWLKLRVENYHPAMQFQMFDSAINHGMYETIRMLQRAVGAKDDGMAGARTMFHVERTELNDLLMLFLAERLDFMTEVRTWQKFGKGWSRRISNNLRLATADNDL
jgi:lysozyme family protein